MRKLNLGIILIVLLTIGCNTENKSLKKQTENSTVSEIVNVIGFFNTDGQVKMKLIDENKTLNWCYDIEDLLKIDLLGRASNVTIDFTTNNDETINIMTDGEINGSYTITPMTFNSSLMGGKIVVKSKNKVIYSLNIAYEGCI